MHLEDYGLIGDLNTAALVSRDGSIDWLCLPRIDSGACLAALLGSPKNGRWLLAPEESGAHAMQRYRPDTLILETEFQTSSGVVRVTDFMPPADDRHDIVRLVEGVRGRVRMRLELIVRFDYGETVPWASRIDGGTRFVAGPNALMLRSDVPVHGEDLTTRAAFEVAAGERREFVLAWFRSHEPTPAAIDTAAALAHTEKFWRDWCSRCTYQSEWRDAVVRSLITLKALTYAPTGGIVAAATTSLPEHLGGRRNWDYRYCWLRDATFTLFSLMQAGYTDEASAWSDWLLRAVAGDPSQLQMLYGVAGERSLREFELPHLSGYEHSRPVRIGNAAARQFQLDVYGELIDATHLKRHAGLPTSEDAWRVQRHLINFVADHWREPDEGIWEVRGPRRHFTHSKVMAWVALDRGVKSCEQFDLEGDVAHWRETRALIHNEVCARGFNEERRSFTQYYGSPNLDSSLLLLPLVGFLPVTDSRMAGTIAAIQRDLVTDGLVRRYAQVDSEQVDGLPPGEGAFLPCSFWLVDCLCLLGRRAEALELFERLLALRSPLGLLAEEYDTRARRLVGNYPQAFSHVALITSAHNLFTPVHPAEERGDGVAARAAATRGRNTAPSAR
ncbi:MAG TPA: glycoside hydrolase family 15 protein [Candidatus Synoicihabitans sp.]|nr:glycoside hydrolase family 15 protein [Candidatus Synoicihabitans sp.]